MDTVLMVKVIDQLGAETFLSRLEGASTVLYQDSGAQGHGPCRMYSYQLVKTNLFHFFGGKKEFGKRKKKKEAFTIV